VGLRADFGGPAKRVVAAAGAVQEEQLGPGAIARGVIPPRS